VKPLAGALYVSDVFQRPVQWVLTNHENKTNVVTRILIISPYEANQLYNDMTSSTSAALHVYKPRYNSGYASLDHLGLHTISAQSTSPLLGRALAAQLNLFAGQLYVTTHEDYLEICKFLGLCATTLTTEMGEQGWQVAADGFILSDDQDRVGGGSGLKKTPISFLKVLMSTIRRNGDGISKTHIGQLLEGKLLQKSDF
jgi:hypothetical protein